MKYYLFITHYPQKRCHMGIKLLNKKLKISLFSVAVFIFFLVVAMGSLHVMR